CGGDGYSGPRADDDKWECVKCGRASGQYGHYNVRTGQVECPKCPDCSGTGTTSDGMLDPDRLVILADALEDAGCTDEPLLRHLRGWERCPCLGKRCCELADDPDPRWRAAHRCVLCDGVGWRPLPGPH